MSLLGNLINGGKKVIKTIQQDVAQPVIQGALNVTPVGQIVRSAQAAAPVAQRVPQAYQQTTQNIVAAHPALNNPVTRFANTQIVKPMVVATGNVGSIAQGKNPYTGNVRQQIGQAGSDALALGSVLPVGKGLELATKGGQLLPRVLQAGKLGAKTGAGFGAVQGLNEANKENASIANTAKSIATNAAVGGASGAALGAAAPIAGAAGRVAVKAATPKYAGLTAKQVIMDTSKLDTLHLAQSDPQGAAARQTMLDGLHQIKQDHGLDFLSGSNADRKQRIAQYLEQNGEAIPQLQAHQAKIESIRNKSVDLQSKYAPGMRTNAVDSEGNQLGLNGRPLKQTSAITAYHGSTNDKLTSLVPGSKTGLNEKRNLVYLSENKDAAANYAKNRGAGGLGELSDSATGKVYPVSVNGQVLDAYDHATLFKFKNAPGYDQLSGKTKNMLSNDTGLSSDQLEANPELTNFLRQNGVTAVRSHLPNGGPKDTELAIVNPDNISLHGSAAATPTTLSKPQLATPENMPPQTGQTELLPTGQNQGGAALPNNTPQTKRVLNTDRMNLDNGSKQILNQETQDTIDRLSNADVQSFAKDAGLDTKTYTPEMTRKKIAEQLNVRQDAVSLLSQSKQAVDLDTKAELIRRAAERGRTSREQGTDIARQLQARKIIANELDTPEQRIFKLLDNAGVNPEVYSRRLATVNFDNPKEVVAAYRDMVPPKAREWLDTIRYNSMLSSPLTQAVNVFGNAQNVGLIAPIEKTLRGGVDAVHSAVTGAPRQYSALEGGAYAKGVATNLGNAAKNFGDALKGVGKYANPDLEGAIPLAQGGVKGAAYNTLSFPMRVLDGMDKFFRTLAEGGEDAALNARESRGIPILGNRDALKEADASYRVFQTPMGEAGQGIINNGLDEFANRVASLRNSKNPVVSIPAKFTIPFLNTVNNIAKQGIIDYSPLGLANLKGNADKTTAITRAIMGSAVFGGSAAALANGNMTWAEPRDPDERARFRAEGKQPYAVKFGNKWYNFSKLTPAVAFPMAMTAALHDAQANKKLDQSNVDAILEAVSKYGNFLSDQSYAKSIGDMLGAIGGDKEAIASTVSNNVQQVVPFRAFTGWIARIGDDKERKVDTTKGYFDQQVQSLMQQYPGLRGKTDTRDYKGTPIAANNPLLNGFSPVKVTTDRGVSPEDAEADRLKTANQKSPDLNKQQVAELAKTTGTETAKLQKQLVSDPAYQALSDKDKQKQLNKVKSDVSAAYKVDYMAKHGIGEYAPDFTGDRKTKLTSDQKKILDGNTAAYSSKVTTPSTTKTDVNASNDAEYKSLVDKYNQAKKDGSLTDVQDSIARDKLYRAKVGSNFSNDTRTLYEQGKDRINAYLTNSKNAGAEYDQLKAYDQALLDAGITTKLKFKNGLSTKRASGNGSRGGSRKVAKAKTLFKPGVIKAPKTGQIKTGKIAAGKVKSNRIKPPKKVMVNA